MDLSFSSIDLKQEAGPRERIYFVVVLLLIVVMFARWLYLPKMKATQMLSVKVKNAQMQVDLLKKFPVVEPPKLQQPSQDVVGNNEKFNHLVEASNRPKQEVVSSVVRLLTANDVLQGLTLAGISLKSEVDKGGYAVVPAVVDLDGSYGSVIEYINKIEKLDRLVIVDNIEFTMSKTRVSDISAKLYLSVFVVKGRGEMNTLQGGQDQPPAGAPPRQAPNLPTSK